VHEFDASSALLWRHGAEFAKWGTEYDAQRVRDSYAPATLIALMRATDFKSQHARQALQQLMRNPSAGTRQHSIPIACNRNGNVDIQFVLRVHKELCNAHGAAADGLWVDDIDDPSVYRRQSSLVVPLHAPRRSTTSGDAADGGGQIEDFAALAAAIFQHASPQHASPDHFAVKLCLHDRLRIEAPSLLPSRPQTAYGFYSGAGPLGIEALGMAASPPRSAHSDAAKCGGNGDEREHGRDLRRDTLESLLHVSKVRTVEATGQEAYCDRAKHDNGHCDPVEDQMRSVSGSSSGSDSARSAGALSQGYSSSVSSLEHSATDAPASPNSSSRARTGNSATVTAEKRTLAGVSATGPLVNNTVFFFLGELCIRRHQHEHDSDDADAGHARHLAVLSSQMPYEPPACCPLESADYYVAVDLRDVSVWILYNAWDEPVETPWLDLDPDDYPPPWQSRFRPERKGDWARLPNVCVDEQAPHHASADSRNHTGSAEADCGAANRLLAGQIAKSIHHWPLDGDESPLVVSQPIMAATATPNAVLVPVFYRVKPAERSE
jgi:hypothetical protein